MALYATPSGLSEDACHPLFQLVGRGQDTRGAIDPCLVCGRPATWRIERPLGSYIVCDWCDSIIREYDARHPESEPARHVPLTRDDAPPGTSHSD
jgi:hypothetical protein